MTEVAPEKRDSRDLLSEALDAFLTQEQLEILVDRVLQIDKQTWVSCGHCKKKSLVTIPDAKAVVSAMAELLVQAKGRPDGKTSDTGFVVNRNVYVVDDHPETGKEVTP